MNHRDYVCMAFDEFFNDNRLAGKVLDVGCFDTKLKQYFQDKGFEWFGVDKNGGQDIKQGLMESIPFEDNSFDVVFCCHAFEHCERPIDALREFKRVVKVGGHIFIATPSVCEKQIIKGDADHIFVLHPIHMAKLLKYCDIKGVSYDQTQNIPLVQDYNVITIGEKNE